MRLKNDRKAQRGVKNDTREMQGRHARGRRYRAAFREGQPPCVSCSGGGSRGGAGAFERGLCFGTDGRTGGALSRRGCLGGGRSERSRVRPECHRGVRELRRIGRRSGNCARRGGGGANSPAASRAAGGRARAGPAELLDAHPRGVPRYLGRATRKAREARRIRFRVGAAGGVY